MARRGASGTRRRSAIGVGLIGGLAAATLVAGTALAGVSGFTPSSGSMAAGGSDTTTFTVEPPTVLGLPSTSCIVATVSPAPAQFTASFDGLGLGVLPANCALGETTVAMIVTARPTAAGGNYIVTITETEVGGSLIAQTSWPFTVVAPPTTTSTSSTSTTSTTPTSPTTTASSATTTSGATMATTTTTPSASPPTSVSGTTTGSGPGEPGTVTSGDDAGSDEPTRTRTTTGAGGTSTTVEDEAAAAPTHRQTDPPEAFVPGSALDVTDDGYQAIAVSTGLRDDFGGSMPEPIADAAFSPLVIGEILLNSLFGSALGLLIPLAVVTVLGLWAIWRLRHTEDQD